ncbi:DUF4145 domain-containing protein [Methylophaga sp. SB9B]|nr:DUF4145 domain-containing protein [Methylophaga sp. SB9B]
MQHMNKKEIKTTVVADYMLIQGISEGLGAAYKQAISMYVADCYCESLVNFRSCLSNILNILGYINTRDVTLKDLIEDLNNSGKVNLMIPNLMHKIRIAGNKGSHSEEYPEENFNILCNQTYKNFIHLIKLLYPVLHSSNECPTIELTLEKELNIVVMASRALFEDDSNAQYLIAKKLYSNAQNKLLSSTMGYANKKTILELDNGEIETRYHDKRTAFNTTIALQLFDSCQYSMPEAAYEYGKLLLTDGHWLKSASAEDSSHEEGVRRVHFAAIHGISDALYLHGCIRLHGLYSQDINVDYALEDLEEAANKNHPKATLELAKYYYNLGKFELAKNYYVLAEQRGSSIAQCALAKNFIDGTFILDDRYQIDVLLLESSNAGVTEAKLLRARFMIDDSSKKFNPDIPNLYDEYLEKVMDAEVLLEYAQYLIDHNELPAKAMSLLHMAFKEAKHTGHKLLVELLELVLPKIYYEPDSFQMVFKFPPEAQIKLHDFESHKSKARKINPREMTSTAKSADPKLGRNEPCYCGSGKKYKMCCLQ